MAGPRAGAACGAPGCREGGPTVPASAAKLRITRVRVLNNQDIVAVVTYLLASYPDMFAAMLDDALSSVSPKKAS
jgi:hypothetical protein